MGTQESVGIVRRGYEAFIAGDLEWMNEHLHENVVWHVPGHNVLSGDHVGRENVLAFFAKSVQLAVPEFDIHDVTASEDHVVALLTVRWRRPDGAEFEDRNAQVFHLDGDRAVEVWTLAEDPVGFDRFVADAPG